MRPLQYFALSSFALAAAACSGPAFRSADAAPEAAGGPVDAAPARVGVGPAAIRVPVLGMTTLFAAHAEGGVVAFSAEGGEELARHALPGAVIDLCWDAAQQRLLVSVADPELDASRVVALSYGASGFSQQAESPPFEGQARLWANAAGVLVVSEGGGASWSLLDLELSPLGLPKALVKPAGLVDDAPAAARGWVALDANAYDGEADWDALLSVSHTEKWSFSRLLVAAPGRPSSRLAHAPGADELYLVRKLDAESRFEIGRTVVVGPAVPSFVTAVGDDALGELVEVVVVPERDALLAVVAAPGATHTRVAWFSTAGGQTRALSLPGAVFGGAWFGRHTESTGSGRVVVCTAAGAFALSVTEDGVQVVDGFGVAQARPPLIQLTDT